MYKDFFGKLATQKIIVVGDLILDHYLFSEVKRISPEAPVPVAKIKSEEWKMGGAANSAQNIAALGCKVQLFGFLGNDYEGGLLRNLLSSINIDEKVCPGRDNIRTIKKTRVISHNQQMLRLDYEEEYQTDDSMQDELWEQIKLNLNGVSLVVLSDYAKGCLTDRLITEIIGHCNKSGIMTLVDPKPIHKFSYREASVITPNLSETNAMTGNHEENADFMKMGMQLSADLKAKIVMTRGAAGMDGFLAGFHNFHIPPLIESQVYDVTGAGDTVIGIMAGFLSTGASLQDAAWMASAGAALSVMRFGTAHITADELQSSLNLIYAKKNFQAE